MAALLLAMAIAAGARADAGTVVYATNAAGYVDAGGDHGVTQGMELKILRHRRPIGTCTVVEVASDRLLCKSERILPGDAVALPPPVAKAVAAPEKIERRTEKAPMSDFEMESVKDIVDSAPLTKVQAHKSAQILPISTNGSATVKQQVWAISTAPGAGAFVRTTLDFGGRTGWDTDFGTLFLSGAARAQADLLAPQARRLQRDDAIYVWDASAGISGGTIVGEVGRFRPRMAPGMTLLDGAQAGVKLGPAEVGVYGGSVPDLITTLPVNIAGGPLFQQLAAGAYFGIDIDVGGGVLILPRARIGVVTAPDFTSTRGEFATQAELVWQNVGIFGAGIRLDTQQKLASIPSIDDAQLEADVSALAPLRLNIEYHYFSEPLVDLDLVVDHLAPVGATHHLNASALYPLLDDNLEVGGAAGGGYDALTAALRAYAGPDVALPQAFGAFGGLDVGVQAEIGAFSGRSGFLGTRLSLVPTLQLMTRLSYFDADALGEPYREVGLMNIADWTLTPWLTLRATVYLQQALPPLRGAVRATPSVAYGDVGLNGAI